MATRPQMVALWKSRVGRRETGRNCSYVWDIVYPPWQCIGDWCAAFLQASRVELGMPILWPNRLEYLVSDLVAEARSEGLWVNSSKAQPGDWVAFHSRSGAKFVHIEGYESHYNSNTLVTYGGNTGMPGGGEGVARKLRPLVGSSLVVAGVIRVPDYSDTPYVGHGGMTAPTPARRIPGTPDALLKVDGALGNKTKVAICHVVGRSHWDDTRQYGPGAKSYIQWKLNKLGIRDANGNTLRIDGEGLESNETGRYPRTGRTHTIEALQRFYGTTRDGYLSPGSSDLVKKIQADVNNGVLFG